jgi:hypothetical protein
MVVRLNVPSRPGKVGIQSGATRRYDSGSQDFDDPSLRVLTLYIPVAND